MDRRKSKSNSSSSNRRSVKLKLSCDDSNICLILGHPMQDKIRRFFHNFVDFKYLTQLKRIGKPSDNGFVHQLTYARRDYMAYAVLKSSAETSSDNLMYEYLVGLYLNDQGKQFPCFVETYGVFKYKNLAEWTHVKDSMTVAPDEIEAFKGRLELTPVDIPTSCIEPKLISILLQNLPSAEFVVHELTYVNTISNLLAIYYQLYYPLSLMEFTHYDLHENNVMLYSPLKDNYIEYHYHNPDGSTTQFKSLYVAKMIDYGRAYFSGVTDVMRQVCTIPECNAPRMIEGGGSQVKSQVKRPKSTKKIPYRHVEQSCGNKTGYTFLTLEKKKGQRTEPVNGSDNYYILSSVKNNGHDLRYFIRSRDLIQHKIRFNLYTDADQHPSEAKHSRDFLNTKVKYDIGYGTESVADCGDTGTVCTVTDMRNRLADAIARAGDVFDKFFTSKRKLGDLHVYPDRPFEYRHA